MENSINTDLFIPNDTIGIVIKLSGGADSSILYYALCKHITENDLNIPIYAVSMDTNRKPWYSHYAKKVIEFTKNNLSIEPVEHRTTFLDGNWTTKKYDWTQHCLMMGPINEGLANVAYSGLTQNPTQFELMQTIDHPAFNKDGIRYARDIVLSTDKSRNNHSREPVVKLNPGYTMIRPFVQQTKRAVANWYQAYNLTDTLFPLTYSCEETDTDLKTPLSVVNSFHEHTHCGCCWFCMERIYAFGRLV